MKLTDNNNKNRVVSKKSKSLRRMSEELLLVLSSVGLLHSGLLFAAPADPSGRLGKDLLEQESRLKSKVRKQLAPAITEESKVEDIEQGGPAFMLKGIRFTRSNHLTQEELSGLVRPWLNREVTYGKLQTLLQEINQLYRSKNIYTSVAVFPEQRIENGIVSIRLIEGTIGEIDIQGNRFADDSYFQEWIDYSRHKETVDVSALEKDILFYNRVHDQQLQAELRAGKAFGLTDIVINVPEVDQDTFNVYADNYGYQSTGEFQLSSLYQRQQLFRPGDKALVYVLAATGLKSLSTSYSTVVGTKGLRLGGSLQYTDTEINSGDFSTLDVTGDTLRVGLEASYLAYSTERLWVNVVAALSNTRSKNTIAGEELSDYDTTQYQLGGELNWLGNQWQFTGRMLFSNVNSKEKLLGSHRKLSLYSPRATFIYNFDSPFYALTTLEAQFTSEEEIPGAVSFSLGGPSTLRGYQPGIVSGDKGWYNQIELHYNGFSYKNYLFDVFVFYDHGEVQSTLPKQQLASAGIGLNVAGSKWVTLDLLFGNAMKEVVPNQDSSRVYARLTCQCWQ